MKTINYKGIQIEIPFKIRISIKNETIETSLENFNEVVLLDSIDNIVPLLQIHHESSTYAHRCLKKLHKQTKGSGDFIDKLMGYVDIIPYSVDINLNSNIYTVRYSIEDKYFMECRRNLGGGSQVVHGNIESERI